MLEKNCMCKWVKKMKVETWEKKMAKAMAKQAELEERAAVHRDKLESLIFQHPAFAPYNPDEVREVILSGDTFSDILYYANKGETSFETIEWEVENCVEELEKMGEQALKLEE